MRTRYKIVSDNGFYFITSTTVEWVPVFTSKAYFDIIIQSLSFCRQNKGLKLHAYVILDNHFHLIVSGPNLGRAITDLKKFTARSILRQVEQDGKKWLSDFFAYYKKRHKTKSDHQVWQEGYHPQMIVSDEMLVQKMEYIHNNPVERGLVKVAEHWLYSSARNYVLGDHSVTELDPLPV